MDSVRLIILVSMYVAEYCERYAKLEDIGRRPEEGSDDDELSEEEDCMSSDEEMAGHADP